MNTQEVPDWMIDATNIPKAEALQTLAHRLPEGWNIQIDIERGAGSVTLFAPEDTMYEIDTGGESIEADILEALRFACCASAGTSGLTMEVSGLTTRSEATQAASPLDRRVMPHTLLHGDCLDLMATIESGSVDMILCDLPYGTTDCSWDTVIPFDALWAHYKRLIKPNGAVVLFGCQPFTSALIMQAPKQYKTSWVWNKSQSGGFATAKYHPLKITEDIIVFGFGTVNYYPQMRKGKPRFKGGCKKKNELQSGLKITEARWSEDYYPVNILDYVSDRKGKLHPTQKPVALCEYLIRTYTNEGETVLDNCMGSGTTGIACLNTGRNFIGIEKDQKYFEIARNRIEGHNAMYTAKPAI